MEISNNEKQIVMSVLLPEFAPTFDNKGVIVSPAVLFVTAHKANELANYVHSHMRGSAINAEIRFEPPGTTTINIYAAPLAGYGARHPRAFQNAMANFPNAFEQDRSALAKLSTGGSLNPDDAVPSRKELVSRAALRKLMESKETLEMYISLGDDPPITVKTSKPTSHASLSKEVEEVTGCVRSFDSQDERLRLFKLGPRRPNLMLFIKNAEDRTRLLQSQLKGATITVKFRRLVKAMTSSRAPRHGVLVEIVDIQPREPS